MYFYQRFNFLFVERIQILKSFAIRIFLLYLIMLRIRRENVKFQDAMKYVQKQKPFESIITMVMYK